MKEGRKEGRKERKKEGRKEGRKERMKEGRKGPAPKFLMNMRLFRRRDLCRGIHS